MEKMRMEGKVLKNAYGTALLIYRCALLLLMLLCAIPFLKWGLSPYIRLTLIPAAVLFVWDLFTGRRLWKARDIFLLAAFCAVYAVTIYVNRDSYFVENLKSLLYMAALFLLCYGHDSGRPRTCKVRDIRVYMAVMLVGTFVLSLICFLTFALSIRFEYGDHGAHIGYVGMWGGRLWGLYNANTGGALCAISLIVSFALLLWPLFSKNAPEGIQAKNGSKKGMPLKIFVIVNIVLQFCCLSLTYSRTAMAALGVAAAFAAFFITPVAIRVCSMPKRVITAIVTGVICVIICLALHMGFSAIYAIMPQSAEDTGEVISAVIIEDADESVETSGIAAVLEAVTPAVDEASDAVAVPEVEETGETDARGGDDTLLTGRTVLWKSGFEAFMGSPLFGVTREGLYDAVASNLPTPGWRADLSAGGVHNGILSLLICSGLAGAAFMILFIISVLIKSFRGLKGFDRGQDIAMIFALCIVLFLALTELTEARILYQMNVFSVFFWTMLGFALSFVEAAIRDRKERCHDVVTYKGHGG